MGENAASTQVVALVPLQQYRVAWCQLVRGQGAKIFLHPLKSWESINPNSLHGHLTQKITQISCLLRSSGGDKLSGWSSAPLHRSLLPPGNTDQASAADAPLQPKESANIAAHISTPRYARLYSISSAIYFLRLFRECTVHGKRMVSVRGLENVMLTLRL